MKNVSTECILNSFGWKTTNGKVEYRGFEFKLNSDLPDWRLTEPVEEDYSVRTESTANAEYSVKAPTIKTPGLAEVSPEEALRQEKQIATHSSYVAAQRRVELMKRKLKDRMKKNGSNAVKKSS